MIEFQPEAKRPKLEAWTETSTFQPQFECRFESNHDQNQDKDIDFENLVEFFNRFIDDSILKFLVKTTN